MKTLVTAKVLLAVETVYGETEVIQHRLKHVGKNSTVNIYLLAGNQMFQISDSEDYTAFKFSIVNGTRLSDYTHLVKERGDYEYAKREIQKFKDNQDWLNEEA